MPILKDHIKKSLEDTGKEFMEVHAFVDNPSTKFQRHDVTRMIEMGKYFEKNYGAEAVREYIQHIHDDFKSKFEHFFEDAEKYIAPGQMPEIEKLIWGVLRYFGVRRLDVKPLISDIEILRKAEMTEEDIKHSVMVARKAIDIAARTGVDLDMELVSRGALFHDLGKTVTHGIEHGRIGAELGKSLGLPDNVNVIMEKHIRGGLTKEEASELGLPIKDYELKLLEERIIIYADRLVDIVMDGVAGDWEAENSFDEILKTMPKYGKNEVTLQRYLGYHKEIEGLINSAR